MGGFVTVGFRCCWFTVVISPCIKSILPVMMMMMLMTAVNESALVSVATILNESALSHKAMFVHVG